LRKAEPASSTPDPHAPAHWDPVADCDSVADAAAITDADPHSIDPKEAAADCEAL